MDTAKLFANGPSQAVRLPKAYRLPGKEVFIKRIGSSVILMPKSETWKCLREGAAMFTSDFLTEREQLSAERREEL